MLGGVHVDKNASTIPTMADQRCKGSYLVKAGCMAERSNRFEYLDTGHWPLF